MMEWLLDSSNAVLVLTAGAIILTLVILVPVIYLENKIRNRKDK